MLNSDLTSDQDSIIALSSPQGSGAIALLRLSGVNAIDIANNFSLLSSKDEIINVKSHTIYHGWVLNKKTEKKIDEVLFFVMRGPKTFTGQDTIEISCHNNPFIVEQIIQQAINYGARLAQSGEFTKRAFLNNKIDLIQAEAINDIINSQTELALKKAQGQLEGSLSSFVKKIEDQLVELLGLVEASFEFLEEEQKDLGFEDSIKNKIISFVKELKEIKKNFSWQNQIRNGISIAIIGTVNAGKSTLFNALLKKDRAIVSSIEGTTRDVVESSVYKNGNFWRFVDTAGLRQTDNEIEKEGIKRSMQEADKADIVLLIVDSSLNMNSDLVEIYKRIFTKHKNKIIFVFSKIDLISNFDNIHKKFNFISEYIKISAKNKKNIDFLGKKIENEIQKLFKKLDSPFLLNKRQFNLLQDLEKNMDIIVQNLSGCVQLELIAYHLKESLEKISELTGRDVTNKVLDRIFNSFCIGK